jgi:hypothetical protein
MDAVQHSSMTTLKRRLNEAEWDTAQQSNPCVTFSLASQWRKKHGFAGPHLLTRCTTCPMMARRALEGVSLIIPKSRNASFPSGVASRLPGCGSATGIRISRAGQDLLKLGGQPAFARAVPVGFASHLFAGRSRQCALTASLLGQNTWPYPVFLLAKPPERGKWTQDDDNKLPASMITKGSDNTRQLNKVCVQRDSSSSIMRHSGRGRTVKKETRSERSRTAQVQCPSGGLPSSAFLLGGAFGGAGSDLRGRSPPRAAAAGCTGCPCSPAAECPAPAAGWRAGRSAWFPGSTPAHPQPPSQGAKGSSAQLQMGILV